MSSVQSAMPKVLPTALGVAVASATRAQGNRARLDGVTEQRVRGRPVGTVPITAGPTTTVGGNVVMRTRATVAQTSSGVRQRLTIDEPRTDVFVDRASCNVTSP